MSTSKRHTSHDVPVASNNEAAPKRRCWHPCLRLCLAALTLAVLGAACAVQQPRVDEAESRSTGENTSAPSTAEAPQPTAEPEFESVLALANPCLDAEPAAPPTANAGSSLLDQLEASQTIGEFFGPGLPAGYQEANNQFIGEPVLLNDGRIVSVTFENNFYVWDPTQSTELPQLSAPQPFRLTSIAAGPGSLAIVADQEGGAHIFDADEPAEPLHSFEWFTGSPTLAVLCDGRFVAGDGDTIVVWDPRTEEALEFVHPDGRIRDMHGLADGRLITASATGKVRVWDFVDRQEPRSFDSSFDDPSLQIVELDNGMFAVSDGASNVQVFDPNGGDAPVAQRGIASDSGSASISTQYQMAAYPGAKLVIETANGAAELWDPLTGDAVALEAGSAPEDVPRELADFWGDESLLFESLLELVVSPDGSAVISASSNDIVRVWQISTAGDVALDNAAIEPSVVSTLVPGFGVTTRLVAPGEGVVVAVSFLGARVLHIEDLIAAATRPTPRTTAVAVAPDRMATGHSDGSITIVSLDSNEQSLRAPSGPVVALALSDDGAIAATSATDESDPAVHIFSPGREPQTIEIANEVTVAEYSTVLESYVVGLSSGEVFRLDANGSLVSMLRTDETPVTDIIDLTNERIAVATDASTVWILDPADFSVIELDHPFGAPGPMAAVGGSLITSEGEGRFRVWSLEDLSAQPQLIETDIVLPAAIAALRGLEDRFLVAAYSSEVSVVSFDGTRLASVTANQSSIYFDTIPGRIAIASPTGAFAIDGASLTSDVRAKPGRRGSDGASPIEAIEPVVVWESPAVQSSGITALAEPAFLSTVHELADGSLVGIGAESAQGPGIWKWPAGQLADPEVALLPEATSTILSSIVVDEKYLVLSALGAFDPEDPEAGTPEGRLEYWDLDSLTEGPYFVDREAYVLAMTPLDDGRFAYGDLRPPIRRLAIGDVANPENVSFISEQSAPIALTTLVDGRLASDGIAIWDPAEPDSRPERLGKSALAQDLRPLPGGGLVWGLTGAWGIDRLDGSGTETYSVADADHNLVAEPLADGRVLVNGPNGIEIYGLDDPTTRIAAYPLPEGTTGPVYRSEMMVTDTHVIGTARGETLWVWDLDNPGQTGTPFEGGKPLAALRDGRVMSATDQGVIIWDPATVTGGSTSNLGRLCDSTSPLPGDLWVGTEQGSVLRWNWESAPDAAPTVMIRHDDEVIEALAIGDHVVTGSHDGTVRVTNAATGAEVAVVNHPGGRVTAAAALADGRIAAAGSDGTIIVIDPTSPADFVVVGGQGIAEYNLSGATVLSLGGLADGRISAGFVENRLRIFEAVGDGAQIDTAYSGLPGNQLVTSAGQILLPFASGIFAYSVDEFGLEDTFFLGADGLAGPVELPDGRIVTIADDGTVFTLDAASEASAFVNVGSVPGSSRKCLATVGDGLVSYTDGAVVRIVRL